jgi:chromosomal replication initiator protein
MQDYKDLWNKILAEVELEVSRANFLTLFKRTQLLSVDDNVLTIAAPSAMIIDLLQRRFYDVIKKAADKHTGKDVSIVFAPKTIIDAVADKERKDGPLFETQNKNSVSVGHLPRVRPDYTFANMAVSSSNQLAFVSASTVAKKPGETYNPLFIYGPTGVGREDAFNAGYR